MKAQVGGVWKTEMDGVIVKTPVGEGKGGGESRRHRWACGHMPWGVMKT